MKRSLSRTIAACTFALGATTLARADAPERLTTAADTTSLNITVYNGGIALVHDRRRVSFPDGVQRLDWRDVAAQLQPETALLSEPSHPRDLSVVEQNFDYDVLGPASVLAKYVGHDVVITHPKADGVHPLRETAKLLANADGVVLQYADRIETSIDGTISYPRLPPDLRDRPTLVLSVDTRASGAHDLDLAYLTGGIGWHAEYVGVVAPDGKTLNLDGLVTLSNQSGTTYRNARLQLVAGNVNAPPPAAAGNTSETDVVLAAPGVQLHEENYFEYHLYTLARPTTIEQNQTKQVSLLSARAVPVTETLELRGSPSYYESADADLGQRLPVGAYVTFANKGGELGVPLPGGTVRLYKNDRGGTSQFLGADAIDHTPANEDVRLHVGDSFDVTARKKQTDFHASFPTFESSYDVVISNAKKQPQDVLVVEPIPCDWTVTRTSAPFAKTSSSTATWTLHVPANGKTTLSYTTKIHCI